MSRLILAVGIVLPLVLTACAGPSDRGMALEQGIGNGVLDNGETEAMSPAYGPSSGGASYHYMGTPTRGADSTP